MRISGEFRQVFRSLRRAPWYAASLAGVIALAIALSATVFATVDGALFKQLPYADSSRLFALSGGWSKLNETRAMPSISPAEFFEWQQTLPDLKMTAFSAGDLATVGVRDSVRSARIDATFFEVVGSRPVAGGFSAADFQPPMPSIRPALVSHAFWQLRLGGDPSAIGRVLTDDTGKGIRVAGILPSDFVFPFPARGEFAPQVLTPNVDVVPRSPGASRVVLVRLGPSSTAATTAQRLSSAAAAWAAAHPPSPAPPNASERSRIMRGPYDRVSLAPIHEALLSSVSGKSWTVFGAAAVLILLASLNTASLAIARTRDRWRDFAVRRALGAGFANLIRLMALENALIVIAGAIAGLAATPMLLTITQRLIGDSYLTVLKSPALDVRVFLFAAIATTTSVALVTLLTARSVSRASLRSAIAERGRARHRDRRGSGLVAVQVAIALVVAVAGALVAGSLLRAWSEEPGLDTQDTALVAMSQPEGASAADIEELASAIGRLPGVVHAGGTAHWMLARAFNGSVFDRPPGIAPEETGSGRFPIESIAVTHGYLEAAGLTLRDGRLPTEAEFTSGAAVIVVSETVAREYWPRQRAVGQVLTNSGRDFAVVGVVPDVRYMSLDLEPQGEIYWPLAATPRPGVSFFVLKLDARRPATLDEIAVRVKHTCPACWFRTATMLDDALADTIKPRQFSARLFSAFGIAALVIAGAGILGLVTMTTNRRTREIGIRMALGSNRIDVVRQILREQLSAVATGLAAGGLTAAWLVRLVDAYLYKTSVYDVAAWLVAIAALAGITAAGALLPAMRASRINPVQALRNE